MHQLGRFVRSTGGLLIIIGVLHVLVGLSMIHVLFDIAADGVVDAVDAHEDREVWFWHMTAGWMMLLLGQLIRWIEHRHGRLPAFLGWATLAIAVYGVVLNPVSGFWAILAVAGLMLRDAYRKPSAVYLPPRQSSEPALGSMRSAAPES
jgi:hypothetical protein